MFFKADAKRIFDTDILLSDTMDTAIRTWNQIYAGHPKWVDQDSHVKTINFAKSVSSETARLTCLDLSIKISGSPRADYLQGVIDNMFVKIREYVEKGCVNGTVILKPNGDGIDCFDPQRFLPTEIDGNGNIRAGIFFDFYEQSKRFYKRLEYHRFVNDVYLVSNRCFIKQFHFFGCANRYGKNTVERIDAGSCNRKFREAFIFGIQNTNGKQY